MSKRSKAKQNRGAINKKVLLIGAIIIVIGAALISKQYNIVSFNTYTTQSSDQQSGVSNYYNPVHGARFDYPSDWKKQEYNDPSIIHVLFLKDNDASFRFDKNNLSTMTMEQYNKASLNALKNVPGFTLIEEKDVTINGQQYHQVVYTNNGDKGAKFKTMQLWTLTDKKGYGFSYVANEDQYDTYMPQAESIINSISLF